MSGGWTATCRSKGHDTRVFRLKRLAMFEGYHKFPQVDDRLFFVFPRGSCKTLRVVNLEEGEDELLWPALSLELWSPNSQRRPFYPGIAPNLEEFTPPFPFIDSHRGRFDPSRSPQYYDARRPYLPFIRRSDKGTMSREEVECVPIFLIWESSAYPSENKGYIQDEYWDNLVERALRLRDKARRLRYHPSSLTFPGFSDSYPPPTSTELNSRFPGRVSFEDMVVLISKIQHETRLLAAWVRMAEALASDPFENSHRVREVFLDARAIDSLMGLWVNGLPEDITCWFARQRLPIFICHEIRSPLDKPEERTERVWVKDTLDSCELTQSDILQEWTRLYKGAQGDPGEKWSGGVESSEKMFMDKLERWRSSSRATDRNFPGEDWGEVTETPMDIKEDGFLPPRPTLASPPPGYAPYIIPPPVQPSNSKLRIRHYVDDYNDEGERCFKYTSQTERYSSYDYTYFDRQRRRHLHMDSRLFIAPEIAHLVEIYGLPGPRRKFYDDFHCQIRAKSSFWVYEDESPRSRDLGKVAPTPPPERLRLLQQSQLPVVDDGEQEDAVDTEFADLSPGHSMEDAVVESDLSSGGLDVEEPAPLTPPDTETNDGAEMKQSETVEDGTMWIPHMVASLVPGQTPVCTWNVSPFLKVFGIGSVEIVEFREWLQRTAPSLRLMSVARAVYHVYEGEEELNHTVAMYLKFWDRRNAASFNDAFQGTEVSGMAMTIEGSTLLEYRHIKKKDLIDYWDHTLAGKLNPLINRLTDPLIRRIGDNPKANKRRRIEVKLDREGDSGRVDAVTKSEGKPREEMMSSTRRGGRGWKRIKERMGDMA